MSTPHGELAAVTEDDRVLQIGEAARLLGVHVETLRRWDAAGTLAAHRSPTKQRYYLVREVEQHRAEREARRFADAAVA